MIHDGGACSLATTSLGAATRRLAKAVAGVMGCAVFRHGDGDGAHGEALPETGAASGLLGWTERSKSSRSGLCGRRGDDRLGDAAAA